ncbi:RimJ/RimL family protein N-acetyltransferase [Microbacterium endophyticum]|uniref:RimJ/RimL family protein N-acetyltransferase n=1 Tax=Microbacterium endophyticum TaxID=1526412 RepID=A0A7W4YMN3_9MICO|nr:GNAT family protein [Microbacterium endophyticum]MBB2976373.1 RimJ/RimL family protein N-acetyltransferase [Microbacterium endophyticum]NIK35254.1 RimJ/RimL family protein N-acetyltransferase [Microbacterium endophyticum]
MLLTTAVTLANDYVRLEPLAQAHANDLRDATVGLEHAWYTSVPTGDTVEHEIDRRRGLHERGDMNPWAVRDLSSGRAVGMTTFCNIDQANRHVEIGYTWLGIRAQRSAVNTAAKHLLLSHAFDECDAIAVEFRTHWHNRQSRAAIERLGARRDGVLRNHQVSPDGMLRDTVVYSILPHEWPGVRRGLEARLASS